MRYVLDFLYLFAGLAYSPVIIYRALRHKRYRAGWEQRFGKINRKDNSRKCIWIHAVSVGEVNAAKTVVTELRKKFHEFEIVVSTTTDTGFARANNLFSKEHLVFYFPFDFSCVMRRAFARLNPAICLLMELEVWPNFVDLAQRSNVPVIIVNGRISERSFSRYNLIKPFVKKTFRKVSLILAQTQEYANRFKEIGGRQDSVVVTGSLKYDTAQITDKVEGTDTLAEQINIGDERLWVAGATGPGEEKIILEVFTELQRQKKHKDLRVVIVPRKPERFNEVAQLIADAGFDFVRYSEIKGTDINYSKKPPVILGDTMGDLRKFYCLAKIIFVGRSLVPMGGSDMMEAAALGKCTIFGPHAFNFKQTVDALVENNGAIMVHDQKELLAAMQKCLNEPEYAERIANNGREVISKNQGATQKTIEQITKILNTA
ncbi:MAG: 3-deoxy-D-manno-octulosonic acid transferase [Sedimentisphaerales bacterium]|nr:3-deoxy-D-manno-octulosonic acid transferase [Sedimentisphaerales bacterium]